jgi:hypothetical protein
MLFGSFMSASPSWIDFADDDAVLFQLGARRETESKKRALRRRVNAVLRNSHERRPRIDVHDASAALRSHHRYHGLHRDNRAQHVEVEDFVKKRRIDLLYCGRIAAPCIVYETVDAAVMLVHSAYGFPHSIKLRHVYGDRQAARKLLRQFLQRIGTASEQGDVGAAIRQRGCRREDGKPDTKRSNTDEFSLRRAQQAPLAFQVPTAVYHQPAPVLSSESRIFRRAGVRRLL